MLIINYRTSSATALHPATTTKVPLPMPTHRLTVPTTLSPLLTRTPFLLLSRLLVTTNSTAQTVSRVSLPVSPRPRPPLHPLHLHRPTPYLVFLALVLTVSRVVLMLPMPVLLLADRALLAQVTLLRPHRAPVALQVPEVPRSVRASSPLPTRVHAWLLAALSHSSLSLLRL